MPSLPFPILAVVTVAYCVLMALDLAFLLPHPYFFLSSKYGGYAAKNSRLGFIHTPAGINISFAAWFVSLALAASGMAPLSGLLVNFLLCYHFFISQRWTSLFRGYGAPGFISWWLGTALLLLHLAARFLPQEFSLTLLAIQTDFALIMFSAGLYKALAGYPKNEGMEYGMVNPMWGYLFRVFRRIRTNSIFYWTLNECAWTFEILAAVCMLIPSLRWVGGVMILLSFLLIVVLIRLGVLCEKVILCCFLFFPALPLPALRWFPQPTQAPIEFGASLAVVALCAYLIVRPLATLGLLINFVLKRPLYGKLQPALELFCNAFGVILWRVFTKEVVNFYIEIEAQEEDGTVIKLSGYPERRNRRFNHVGEAITVATIFTSLKYFNSRPEIFRDRLTRYAHSLASKTTKSLLFRYIKIEKEGFRFVDKPLICWTVELSSMTISEVELHPDCRKELKVSSNAAVECAAPGSYLPARI